MFWTVLAVGLGAHGWWSESWIEMGFGIFAGVIGVRRAVMQWDKPGAFANCVATVIAFSFLIATMVADDTTKQSMRERARAPVAIKQAPTSPAPATTNTPRPRATVNTTPSTPPPAVSSTPTARSLQNEPPLTVWDFSENLEQREPIRNADFGGLDGEMATAGAESKEIPFKPVSGMPCRLFLYFKHTALPEYGLQVIVRNEDGSTIEFAQDKGVATIDKIGAESAGRLQWIKLKLTEGSVENKSIGVVRSCLKSNAAVTTSLPEDVTPIHFEAPTGGANAPYPIPYDTWSEVIVDRPGCRMQFVKLGHFELDLDSTKNGATGGWDTRVRVINGEPRALGYKYLCR